MTGFWRAAWAAARLELSLLVRDRAFVALTVLAAVSFVAMVSLFGLTGSRAPVALIDRDRSAESAAFAAALDRAHHSFALRPMSAASAQELLGRGRLVASITIPAGFGEQVRQGRTVPLDVVVDNVDVDLTADVQRALPSAIVDFGRTAGLPGLRLRVVEHDAWPHDTDYVPYLAVSALALDCFVLAGSLGALTVAREWEGGTVKLLRMAPVSAVAVLAGKLAAAAAAAALALAAAVALIVLGYGLRPAAPLALAGTLIACVAIFTLLGAWIGALLRRTAPIVPLMFGLVMPFYFDSGALEPTRFDGDAVWLIAHVSPLYYAVGVLEWAFHGLLVTPEPVLVDLAVLGGLAVLSLVAARDALRAPA